MTEKAKIGIAGLGLIGGSIEKNLKAKGYEVLTIDKDSGELKDLQNCDLVFLCAPQFTIIKQLEEIAKIIAQSSEKGSLENSERAFAKTIITDVGSSKTAICQKACELGLDNFIGGHPMAGTEKAGYEASFPELFEGANWIVTESDPQVQLLESTIQELGAKPIFMDAITHDKAVAVTSHLPLTLSIALSDIENSNNQAQKVIGPCFREMTRVAHGNEFLSRDIIAANRENIKEVWDTFKALVDSLLEIPTANLLEELQNIKENKNSENKSEKLELVTK